MRPFTRAELLLNAARIARDFPSFSLRPYQSPGAIERYQLQRIQKLVKHAEAAVPLYREKFRRAGVTAKDLRSLRDFEHFPTTTKAEVLAAYPDGCLARGLDLGRCLLSKSSGSTGTVLDVVHRADPVAVQGLAMNRLLSLYGPYLPWDRFVYVYTAPYPAASLFGAWPMVFVPTLAKTRDIAAKLIELKPALLACYPSHLRAIADELGPERARALGLRAISVSSEASTARERRSLGRIFGCGVFDEYSTEELTRVAAQCRYGTYHLFEDVTYLEILDASGAPTSGVGDVVGTYLHNDAMPFIRYRQGDLASVSHRACACGIRFRAIDALVGRELSSFQLPSGRVLTSGYLLDASYSFLFDVGADIAAFTITQETRERVVIELVPGKTFSAPMRDAVRTRFLELVDEPLDVQVEVVPEVRRSAAGKHTPIVSHLRPTTRQGTSSS